MATINFFDETATELGTPVNRLRLMGMQGFFPATTTIVDGSTVVITESSAEGTLSTTITESVSGAVTVIETFTAANGQRITKRTEISETGSTTTVTETVTG